MAVNGFIKNNGVLEPVQSQGFTSNNHENLSNLAYPAGHVGFSDTKIRNLPDTYSISATPSTPGTGYIINDICSAQAGTRYFTYEITEVGDAGEIISGTLSPTILAEPVNGTVTLNGGSGTGGMITLTSSAAQQHTQEIKFSDTLNQMDSSKNETAIPTYITDAAGNLQFGKTAETDLIAGLARTDLVNVTNADFAAKADAAGVAGTWGKISGTIEDQTDLVNKFPEKITDTGNIALVNNVDSGKVFSDILSSQSTENEYVSAKIIYDYIVEHALNSNDYQGLFTYFGERTAIEAQTSVAGDKAISFEGAIGAVTNVIRGDYDGSTWTWATAVPQAKNAMWIFAHKLLNETNTPFGMAIYNDDQSNPANFGTVAFPMFTPDDIDIEINGNGKLAFTASANNRINSKEPAIIPGISGQFYAGDKTFKAITADDVPELPGYAQADKTVEKFMMNGLLSAGGDRWVKICEKKSTDNTSEAQILISGTGYRNDKTGGFCLAHLYGDASSASNLSVYGIANSETQRLSYGYLRNTTTGMVELWIKRTAGMQGTWCMKVGDGITSANNPLKFGLLEELTTEPTGIVYVTPQLLPDYAAKDSTVNRYAPFNSFGGKWIKVFSAPSGAEIAQTALFHSKVDGPNIALSLVTLEAQSTATSNNIFLKVRYFADALPTAHFQFGYTINADYSVDVWLKCGSASEDIAFNNIGRHPDRQMYFRYISESATEPAGIVYVTPEPIDLYQPMPNVGVISTTDQWNTIISRVVNNSIYEFIAVVSSGVLSGDRPPPVNTNMHFTVVKGNGAVNVFARSQQSNVSMDILYASDRSATGSTGWHITDLYQPTPIETITTQEEWLALVDKIPDYSDYFFRGAISSGVFSGDNPPGGWNIFRVSKHTGRNIEAQAIEGSTGNTRVTTVADGLTGWRFDNLYQPFPSEGDNVTLDQWKAILAKIPVNTTYMFRAALNNGVLTGPNPPYNNGGISQIFRVVRLSATGYYAESWVTNYSDGWGYVSSLGDATTNWTLGYTYKSSPIETITTTAQWDLIMSRILPYSEYSFWANVTAEVLAGNNVPKAAWFIARKHGDNNNITVIATSFDRSTGNEYLMYKSGVGNGRTGWDIITGYPAPPATGTYTLQSVNGVVSWV